MTDFDNYLKKITNPDIRLILLTDFRGDTKAARTAYFVEMLMKVTVDQQNKIIDNLNDQIHGDQGAIQKVHDKLDLLLLRK